MDAYDGVKSELLTGWGTWDVTSVISYLLLPEGRGLSLGIKEYQSGQVLEKVLIGSINPEAPKVTVGPRDYQGSYTMVTVEWKEMAFSVETTSEGNHITILVTPIRQQKKPSTLFIEGFQSAGRFCNEYTLQSTDLDTNSDPLRDIWISGNPFYDPYLYRRGRYRAVSLNEPIVISTSGPQTVEEVKAKLFKRRQKVERHWKRYGKDSELAEAMHTCLAWDTVFDPLKDRAISPVSRQWCLNHGGTVLFCWDTFFAALMALAESPELAAANAMEIINEVTPSGFVPNYAYATGQRSLDRSQPPIGSFVIHEIVTETGWLWLAEETFDALLRWNRWWVGARTWKDCLCWGSNPFEPEFGNVWETRGVNDRFGAALESGLDNSPMYDDVPFDKLSNCLRLADVGLTALYIADCRSLACLARLIGRDAEADELEVRRAAYERGLESLWSEEHGLYLNRRTDTLEFQHRLSPTHFYPLLAGHPSRERAKRMIDEHLLNPNEFWGEFVLPSIARNDPAFGDQEYWRGRIWAPMNFLVYLGVRQYDAAVASQLAKKSGDLLLKEWREERHIHENYNAITGDGDDIHSSDAFYHWGALLSMISLIDAGHISLVGFVNS